MKTVSIQDLKSQFAAWASVAAGGEPVRITKHNRPYLMLTRCDESAVHYGSRVGEALRPAFTEPATNGAWREILDEDRQEDR